MSIFCVESLAVQLPEYGVLLGIFYYSVGITTKSRTFDQKEYQYFAMKLGGGAGGSDCDDVIMEIYL